MRTSEALCVSAEFMRILADIPVVKSSVKDLLGYGVAKLKRTSCRGPCEGLVDGCRTAGIHIILQSVASAGILPRSEPPHKRSRTTTPWDDRNELPTSTLQLWRTRTHTRTDLDSATQGCQKTCPLVQHAHARPVQRFSDTTSLQSLVLKERNERLGILPAAPIWIATSSRVISPLRATCTYEVWVDGAVCESM